VSFSVVGAIGFLVDATVLYLSMGYLGPFYGRCASLVCSMTVTWLLNRNITFAESAQRHATWVEAVFYLMIMSAGAAINFGIYALLLLSSDLVQSYPIIGVAVGSGIALAWNFYAARTLLYGSYIKS
jgi:putative flippase GtrA